MDENVDVAKKKSVVRSSISKKDGTKVHRKIHKAEREKLKRDRMNELFLELTKALEPATQNSGKSSSLTDTIRILRDLMAQVDSLKKENSVLLAESQYVAVEKNELKEENSAIEAQIKKLQSQIADRVHYPSSYLECNASCGPCICGAPTERPEALCRDDNEATRDKCEQTTRSIPIGL